jgi:hypothetical protein
MMQYTCAIMMMCNLPCACVFKCRIHGVFYLLSSQDDTRAYLALLCCRIVFLTDAVLAKGKKYV